MSVQRFHTPETDNELNRGRFGTHERWLARLVLLAIAGTLYLVYRAVIILQ
jgi:hypothetical protein